MKSKKQLDLVQEENKGEINILTFLDFFSGVGGFRLGMETAGHKCLGHCEIDKFANRSYNVIHEPGEDEWYGEDITKVTGDELPNADCWCAGFPCQDISVAGKQRGLDGDRSSLFFSITRLIREKKEEDRPKYLFLENVKNLFSINKGFDFLTILSELDEIGYDVEWDLLNSKEVVPQNRERVFIIGHLRGRSGRKVFPITRESRTTNKESGKINIIGTTKKDSTKIGQRDLVYGDGIMGSLTATDYKQPKQIGINQVGNVLNTTRFGGNPQDGRVYSTEGISPSLITGSSKIAKIVVPCLTPDRLNKRQNGRRFKEDGEPMFPLTSQDRHGVLINEINDIRLRKLTPRECFRLQGIPDWAFDKAREVNSDSQLYKQAGNGVTVNVIYEIAKKLK
ncbi:DNA cytosine methyltransferase [Metaclostridioides mangenotii]|uniref:DNA cytosine methyltransferase n=1 Tax=Metaclostridioides mangenotii TaxID=1540 RepID=UPI00097C6345|nr:DNA cytosine methyltransferase [Clostridioides mangenotii]